MGLLLNNALVLHAEPETKLDQALISARNDDARRVDYYNAFLETLFYLATVEDREAIENSFQPLIVKIDGQDYVMFFDSEARLNAWAKRDAGFMTFSGRVLARMLQPEWLWAVNVGTDYARTFDAEEITWLKETLAQNTDQGDVL